MVRADEHRVGDGVHPMLIPGPPEVHRRTGAAAPVPATVPVARHGRRIAGVAPRPGPRSTETMHTSPTSHSARSRASRWWPAWALVLVVSLFAAACGGGSDDASGGGDGGSG